MRLSLRQKRRARGERLQRMYAMQAFFIQRVAARKLTGVTIDNGRHSIALPEFPLPLSYWERSRAYGLSLIYRIAVYQWLVRRLAGA